MAILHVKSPNGTTQTLNLATMNITKSDSTKGYIKLPNGSLFQWFFSQELTSSNTFTPITPAIQFSKCFAISVTLTNRVTTRFGGHIKSTTFVGEVFKVFESGGDASIGWIAIGL